MHKSFPVLLVPHPSRNFGEGFLSTADIAFTAVGARIAWINVHTLRILAWSVHELPTLVFCRLQWTHLTVPLEPNGLFPLDECRWGSVDHFITLMGQKQGQAACLLIVKSIPVIRRSRRVLGSPFASQNMSQ
jgi:hypothetical protein